MKLDKLWIREFKNLKDFRVDFDENSSITVIIGWNGAGKSNLFEALSIIFRDLDLNKQTPFAYVIEYFCHGNKIKIDNDPARPARERVIKEIKPISAVTASVDQKTALQYLPNYVFGYYSGSNNRLKECFSDHQKRYYDAVINIEKFDPKTIKELKSIRRLFCGEPVHSKFVLLAFFYKEDKEIKSFLEEYFRIVGLESVLFVMKKPSWARTNNHLWGARGLVRKFLERLYDVSLAPMKLKQRVPTSIKKHKSEELYYLYVKDTKTLGELASEYETQSDFFANIESTFLSEVIHDVLIKVKVRNYDGTLTFRELSEGEQQLLMVLGLLRFTKEKESLILLDEPDTHLNPTWSTEYLDILRKIVDKDSVSKPEQETRHIIMATHDPIVIAGLERSQVQIFKRNPLNDRCYAEIPERSPRGMGFEGILTSDMFGFRSALDKPTLALLDRKRQLQIKDKRSSVDDKELAKLNDQIGDVDFTNVVRDEYYNLFSKSMAEYEKEMNISQMVLTPEQIEKRKQFARKIAASIVKKRDAK